MDYDIKVRMNLEERQLFKQLMDKYGAQAGHINFDLTNGEWLTMRHLRDAEDELSDLRLTLIHEHGGPDSFKEPGDYEPIEEVGRAIERVCQAKNRLELLRQLVAQLKGV